MPRPANARCLAVSPQEGSTNGIQRYPHAPARFARARCDAPPSPPPAARRRAGEPSPERPGAGWRVLAVILFLALAFACAVMVIAMADIGDTPTCADVRSGAAPLPSDLECFDGSSTQKTISLILGWPSGILAGIAALAALFFAITGRVRQARSCS